MSGAHEPPAVVVEVRGALAVLRIEHPAQRNSLSVATLSKLDEAFSSLSTRDDIDALIFTGTGDVFAWR